MCIAGYISITPSTFCWFMPFLFVFISSNMGLSLLLLFQRIQVLDLLILLFFYSLMSTFVYVIIPMWFSSFFPKIFKVECLASLFCFYECNRSSNVLILQMRSAVPGSYKFCYFKHHFNYFLTLQIIVFWIPFLFVCSSRKARSVILIIDWIG